MDALVLKGLVELSFGAVDLNGEARGQNIGVEFKPVIVLRGRSSIELVESAITIGVLTTTNGGKLAVELCRLISEQLVHLIVQAASFDKKAALYKVTATVVFHKLCFSDTGAPDLPKVVAKGLIFLLECLSAPTQTGASSACPGGPASQAGPAASNPVPSLPPAHPGEGSLLVVK